MAVAIVEVHGPKGLWATAGGFEYNLVLVTLLVAIGLMGPGIFSLDSRLPIALPRPHAFLVALTLALLFAGAAILGLP
jgi:hypothetical protein